MFKTLQQFYPRQTNYVIEKFEPSDCRQLAEIHATGFQRAWSDGELSALLAQSAYSCLVARKIGSKKRELAGFVILRTVSDEAEVISIAVRPKARRKGIGRRLMQAAIRQLQTDRAHCLFLEVNETNQAAIELYKELGFKQTGKRDSYYRDEKQVQAALVMALNLG